jgi:hypothetical protein
MKVGGIPTMSEGGVEFVYTVDSVPAQALYL